MMIVINHCFFSFHCQAKLYIKDDKDFCSIAANGKLSLIGVVNVPANDTRSVAVPIVPRKIGEIQIEVSSILQIKFGNSYMNSHGDTVKKTLLVLVCTLYWIRLFLLCFLLFVKQNYQLKTEVSFILQMKLVHKLCLKFFED